MCPYAHTAAVGVHKKNYIENMKIRYLLIFSLIILFTSFKVNNKDEYFINRKDLIHKSITYITAENNKIFDKTSKIIVSKSYKAQATDLSSDFDLPAILNLELEQNDLPKRINKKRVKIRKEKNISGYYIKFQFISIKNGNAKISISLINTEQSEILSRTYKFEKRKNIWQILNNDNGLRTENLVIEPNVGIKYLIEINMPIEDVNNLLGEYITTKDTIYSDCTSKVSLEYSNYYPQFGIRAFTLRKSVLNKIYLHKIKENKTVMEIEFDSIFKGKLDNDISISKSTRKDIYNKYGYDTEKVFNPYFDYSDIGIGFLMEQNNWSDKIEEHSKEKINIINVFKKKE